MGHPYRIREIARPGRAVGGHRRPRAATAAAGSGPAPSPRSTRPSRTCTGSARSCGWPGGRSSSTSSSTPRHGSPRRSAPPWRPSCPASARPSSARGSTSRRPHPAAEIVDTLGPDRRARLAGRGAQGAGRPPGRRGRRPAGRGRHPGGHVRDRPAHQPRGSPTSASTTAPPARPPRTWSTSGSATRPGTVLVTRGDGSFRGEDEREMGFRGDAARAPHRARSSDRPGQRRRPRRRPAPASSSTRSPRTPTSSPSTRCTRSAATARPSRRSPPRAATYRVFVAHDLHEHNLALLHDGHLSAVLHHDLRQDMRHACQVIMQAHGALPRAAAVVALGDPGGDAVQPAAASAAGTWTRDRPPGLARSCGQAASAARADRRAATGSVTCAPATVERPAQGAPRPARETDDRVDRTRAGSG